MGNFIITDRIAYTESLKTKKNEKKMADFYSSIRFLKQIFLIGLDLNKYKNDSNINYCVVIQDYLITKEFSKITKYMYSSFNENYHPKKLLYDCIELTEVVSAF
jgi:hypothetical protein